MIKRKSNLAKENVARVTRRLARGPTGRLIRGFKAKVVAALAPTGLSVLFSLARGLRKFHRESDRIQFFILPFQSAQSTLLRCF